LGGTERIKKPSENLQIVMLEASFAQAIVVTKNYKGQQDNVAFIPAHIFLALV
jgi:hypothetical protein